MSLWRGTLCTNCKKEHECTEAERMLKSGGIAYGCSACIPKTTTNADCIRAMSDEELAEFMYEYSGSSPNCDRVNLAYDYKSCKECWLNWLRKEEESEEKDELTD